MSIVYIKDDFIKLEEKLFTQVKKMHMNLMKDINNDSIDIVKWKHYTQNMMHAINGPSDSINKKSNISSKTFDVFLPYMVIYQNYVDALDKLEAEPGIDSPSDKSPSESSESSES